MKDQISYSVERSRVGNISYRIIIFPYKVIIFLLTITIIRITIQTNNNTNRTFFRFDLKKYFYYYYYEITFYLDVRIQISKFNIIRILYITSNTYNIL